MSTEMQESVDMTTKPVAEHHWLQQLVGEWRYEGEMTGPDGAKQEHRGQEKLISLGGLWAAGEGHATMPGGADMEYRNGYGYDVSFREYSSFMIMSASSHLWTYKGQLSEDRRTLTLDCIGPDMETDGETANYRDVIEIVDDNHRTLTSSSQDKKTGEWQVWLSATYTRV